jgi:ABC-type multidrug transport system fused ATPase/permease subunit
MATSYCYGLVQHLSSLIAGIVIAFIYDWRTALVSTGLLPFLLLAGIIRGAFRTGTAFKSD